MTPRRHRMVVAPPPCHDSAISAPSLAGDAAVAHHYRMPLKALRGATTVATDDAALLAEATQELLRALVQRNALQPSQVISAFFTCTSDLTSAYPAQAARDMGWTQVPMLCGVELPVRGAFPRCIRVLVHVELPVDASEPRHAYLRAAAALRGDLGDGRA